MKTILSIVVLLTAGLLFSYAQKAQIDFSNSRENFVKTVNLSQVHFEVLADVGSLSLFSVNARGSNYAHFTQNNMITAGEYGNPALPVFNKLIQIPENATAEVIVLSYDEQIIDLNAYGIFAPLMPAQPSLSKSEDPDKVPFHYNANAYKDDNFSQVPVAKVEKLGNMRGVNIGRLTLNPVRYNPVTNQLLVMRNLKVKVNFVNADVTKTIEEASRNFSPAFMPMYSSLLNFSTENLKDTLTKYPVKYLIISDRMFETGLQPFIQWKTRKGFNVEVAYTDVIGTTTTAIKSFIAGKYNAGTPASPAPTFVLFVGDVAQIPAFNGTTGSHPTDLYYVEMHGGTDYFPEMYFGRFSAQNTNHLQTYVSKTLQFEQYTMPDPAYLGKSLLVAGVDGSMAPTYGNGQINYATDNYFNVAHNTTPYVYLYGSGSPIISNSPQASPAIKQNVSDGVGFANYTAHCSSSGWADPSFVVSDVPNLTNTNKYCVMVGNCCLSSKFNDNECFAEAITRTAERGAVAYMGGSNSTYWNEDYYYSVGVATITANPTYAGSGLGYYDKLFHDHGEAFSDWYVTTAGINFGGNIAVTEGGTSYVKYYWEIYHVMGDPSLMPYMWQPAVLTANYLTTVPIGVPTVDINTEEHAYVAISMNNVLYRAQYTGTSTTAVIDLSFVSAPCTLDVVITKQNRQPHIGQIVVVPNNSPYVVYFNHLLNDAAGNNNQLADYAENIVMDLTLKNVGNLNATGVSAVLSTTSPHITVTDNSDTFGDINANATSTAVQGYAFNIAPVIPDQHNAIFEIAATNGSDLWTTNFSLVLNAPLLSVPSFSLNDAVGGNNNARLDPGESVVLTFNTLNDGHAVSPDATSVLSCASPYISIVNSTVPITSIGIGQNSPAAFEIQVDPATPIGTPVTFDFNINAAGYTASKSITLPVGLIVEDWETNTFTQFPWATTGTGNLPWIIINSGNIYEGNYSARSGMISHSQQSIMSITLNVLNSDSLSFYKKVSCEQGSVYSTWWDYMEFLVDGTSKQRWDGEIDWSREAFYLTAGTHTLTWKYVKDNSVSSGSDAAWVDFIIFPAIDISIGIESPVISQSLSVYPNPFDGEFNVSCGLGGNTTVSLAVYNSLGQKVLVITENEKLPAGMHNINVPAEALPSGYYIIKMTTPFGEINNPIIKTK